MSNIYVIASGAGMCKIGVAGIPTERVKQLRTGHPHTLEVAHSFKVKNLASVRHRKRAHELLAEHRLEGEWFDVDAERAAIVVRQAIADIDPPKVDPNDTFRLLADPDLLLLRTAYMALSEMQETIIDMMMKGKYTPNQINWIIEAATALSDHLAVQGRDAEDDDI